MAQLMQLSNYKMLYQYCEYSNCFIAVLWGNLNINLDID